MGQEKLTDLPVASSANLGDIIYAVQGFVPSVSLGTSVQETLQQVFDLFKIGFIVDNAGNPNGAVAGSLNQLCWDSTNHILYICTNPGNAATAVWMKTIQLTAGSGVSISQAGSNITISAVSSLFPWVEVLGTSQIMSANTGYIPNNASQVAFTLPVGSNVGDELFVVGEGTGGWIINQNVGQTINLGTSTTTGTTGSLASTHRHDSIHLVCTVANLEWTAASAPQSSGLTIV
jgi:hypothetical protein